MITMYTYYVSLNQAISYCDNQNIFGRDMLLCLRGIYESNINSILKRDYKNLNAISEMVLAHNKTGKNSRKDLFLPCKASAQFQQVIGVCLNQ